MKDKSAGLARDAAVAASLACSNERRCYTDPMGGPRVLPVLALVVVMTGGTDAQTRKAPARKTTPPPKVAPTRVQADVECPSELGVGVKSGRRFCDVLTGRDPNDGVLIRIPHHRGPVTLSFELHNRHTYSEELIKARTAFRDYTATIGVLTMDNTLIDRAVISSQFRSAADLFDRIQGGAGPGGVKAVAPTGSEFVSIEIPEDTQDQVTILGEKLRVLRADGGADTFVAPGRPIATISNVMIEYRPGPPPRKPPKRP
jgi:hypothetical protein